MAAEIITNCEIRITLAEPVTPANAGIQSSLRAIQYLFFVVFCLAGRAQSVSAQTISISLVDSTSALIQVDSANWNDAWIEVSGSDTNAPALSKRDVRVVSDRRMAEVLSVDSSGAKYLTRLALSFVLDNSGSMFHSYDTLSHYCDSILADQPPGLVGQAITFDTRDRNPWELYTAEHSTFIAQSNKDGFTADRASLRSFWHFYDTIRTQFTPLYDAILAAITNIDDRREHDSISRNDVLLVVTDGQDNASRTLVESLAELLANSRIRLFAINYRVEDEGRLPWLAQQCGGAYFLVRDAPNQRALKRILKKIGRDVTRFYHIRYRFPSLGPSPGE